VLRIIFNTGIGALLTPFDPITGISAGIGLNILDTFLVDKLINNWEPKFFIDRVKNVAKST